MATNRGGAATGLDIWVSLRSGTNQPWGAPIALAAPVNTAANEFCPTPLPDGRTLLFVSNKPGGCGGGDIYYTSWLGGNSFSEPVNLGCHVNSAAEEASPSLVILEPTRWQLYFSSTRAGGVLLEPQGEIAGDSDIYVVEIGATGFVGPPSLVPGVNTTFDDFRPNVRSDGREIVFDSNRPGSQGLDIWTSARELTAQAWNAPTNVASVNSTANETRPFFSGDGASLYLGSTRSDSEGSADLYVATRTRQR
jgi:Tol biopolymer transport system component